MAAIVAVMMTMLLIVAAFAVDLGVQRVLRRDMQAMADVIALDMSRSLDGRTQAVIKATSTWRGQLKSSVERNLNGNGTPQVSVQQQQHDAVATVAGSDLVVTVTMGLLDPTTGEFSEIPYPEVPTAVRVVASSSIDFAFAGLVGVSKGSASRSAVGAAEQSACFDLGSYAAAIESGGSSLLGPFNKLLGLNLQLISYQGLAVSNVTLADIAANANVGSVDALLGGDVTFGNFSAAVIDVLDDEDPQGNSAAITALGLIRGSGIDLTKKVDIAKIVGLQNTDDAALESEVSVLDLVGGAIIAANGEHAVDISSLNIAGITGGLSVTQGMQRACGVANDPAATATASQIEADLNVPLALPTGASVLGLTLTGNATVTGGVGNATGRLVGPPAVTCHAGTTASPDTYRVDVNGGLLGLGLRANVTINGTVSTGLLNGLIDGLLGSLVSVTFNNVTVALGTVAPGTSATPQHADLKVPQNAINMTPRGAPVKTGSAFGGVGTVPTITTSTSVGGTISVRTGGIPLLGIGARTTTVALGYGPIGGLISTLLGTVNGTLNSTINTALVPTLNGLLTPLAKLLGVNAGGADVYSEARPTCNGANLVG